MGKQQRSGVKLAQLAAEHSANLYWKKPNDFMRDGEDHINISVYGASPVGKIFDIAFNKDFNYPGLGNFKSVEGLSAWMKSFSNGKTADDTLRSLHSSGLREYIRKNNIARDGRVQNYWAIIGYATWLKLKRRQDIVKQIRELDPGIKFLCYRTVEMSGLRIQSKLAEGLIAIADEICAAVRGDRDPDFTFLCDHPEVSGLNYAEGFMSNFTPVDRIEELKGNTMRDTDDTVYEVQPVEELPWGEELDKAIKEHVQLQGLSDEE